MCDLCCNRIPTHLRNEKPCRNCHPSCQYRILYHKRIGLNPSTLSCHLHMSIYLHNIPLLKHIGYWTNHIPFRDRCIRHKDRFRHYFVRSMRSMNCLCVYMINHRRQPCYKRWVWRFCTEYQDRLIRYKGVLWANASPYGGGNKVVVQGIFAHTEVS